MWKESYSDYSFVPNFISTRLLKSLCEHELSRARRLILRGSDLEMVLVLTRGCVQILRWHQEDTLGDGYQQLKKSFFTPDFIQQRRFTKGPEKMQGLVRDTIRRAGNKNPGQPIEIPELKVLERHGAKNAI